ncbi:hypothetical protein D3C80_1599090 [compost metagenome]
MHTHFATATQSHSVWSDYNRNSRVTNSHHRVLEQFDGHVQFIIFLLNRHHENHSDVGADREIRRLVSNYQTCILFFCQVDCFVDALQNIASDGIHLRLELQIQDAVAQICDYSTRIAPNFFTFSYIIQNDKRILSRNFLLGF